MKIRDILAELAGGKSTAELGREIEGTSKNKLTEGLKLAGYQYSQKAPQGWNYVGENGEEPLDKSLFDYVKKSSQSKGVKGKSPSRGGDVKVVSRSSEPDVKGVSQEVHKSFTRDAPKTKPDGTQPFSSDEIAAMREILSEWTKNKTQSTQRDRLHERIKGLDASDKQRRTIVIDRKVGAALDEFCDAERFTKSDILELAILDFIESYSK